MKLPNFILKVINSKRMNFRGHYKEDIYTSNKLLHIYKMDEIKPFLIVGLTSSPRLVLDKMPQSFQFSNKSFGKNRMVLENDGGEDWEIVGWEPFIDGQNAVILPETLCLCEPDVYKVFEYIPKRIYIKY